jgi:hypothetical protein
MPKRILFSVGEYSAPETRSSWKVSCSGPPPASLETSHTCGTPVISVRKETLMPSGDQLAPQAPLIFRYLANS